MPVKLKRRPSIVPHIRWMIRRDMPEVLDIEKCSFRQPWDENCFIRYLRQRNCIGMVAEHEDRVIGSMVYELHKNKLRILTLAVHPEFRMRRVGYSMVAKLIGKLSFQRRSHLIFDVPADNLDGHLFLRGCGMTAVKVLPERSRSDDGKYYDPRSLAEQYRFMYELIPGEV